MADNNLDKKVSEIEDKVTTQALISRSLNEWRPLLAKDCQVYVCGATYIGKRFDEIHYSFMDKDTAKEVITDNLYAILRYKYFPQKSDEIDDRIEKIIKSFISNLRSTLIKVSFDKFDVDSKLVKYIPNTCVAFRNGVYDFWANDWLMKYEKIKIEEINNSIYMYDPQYIIEWYFNFDFEPIPELSLKDMTLEDCYEVIKAIDGSATVEDEKILCFELMHNIAHDSSDRFDIGKFTHLCEILGYTLMQSFVEAFVMLIGSGQNGKNSLFDGCFSNRLIPRPSSIDMKTIEEDKFVTGSLVNSCHNIFLETEAATQTKSAMIKQLTGSPNQSIQPKGIQAFPGIINCKYIFAGNDQDKIKFSDNTHGFRRRINIFEINYQYKPDRKKHEKGTYYQTDFHDDLHELTDNLLNTIVYIYFGMFGIKEATKCFENNFKFTRNDWKLSYSDIDYDLKEKIEKVTTKDLAKYLSKDINAKLYMGSIYDTASPKRNPILESQSIRDMQVHTANEFVDMLKDEEKSSDYFSEYDIFLDLKLLQSICGDLSTPSNFKSTIKKMYPECSIEKQKGKDVLLVRFYKSRLKVV